MDFSKEDVLACFEHTDLTLLVNAATMDPNTFDFNMPRPQQVRYLLLHVDEQLKRRPGLCTRYFDVFSSHGVHGCVLNALQRGSVGNLVWSDSEVPTTDGGLSHGELPVVARDSNMVAGTKRPLSFVFQEQHLSALTEILSQHSSYWEQIGISLNLPRNTLRNVNVSRKGDPNLCLYDVLSEWVCCLHKNAKPPTLEVLKLALGSNLVGLFRVAHELQDSLERHGVGVTNNEEPAASKRPCVHLPATAVSTTGSVKLRSITRPHLPAECCCGTDTVPHESTLAMNRPHPLAGPLGRHGSTSMNRSAGPLAFMNRYTEILRDVYSAQPEVPKDLWPPGSSHTFINLALIKQHGISCGNKYVCSTIQGDMDDIMKDKESAKYERVFKDFQSKSLVLIEGRPGSGKTTLVHKISQDWADGKGILKGAELVFLISLRVLSNKCEVNSKVILELFYCSDVVDINALQEHINKSNGRGICFILDGLDEYSYDSGIIADIIHKKYLPLSMVIVASRPVATAKLRYKAAERVEVLGFMKEQIFEYVGKYEFQEQTQTSDDLKAYLDRHRNVLHLCYLPVHTAMVCFLYQQLGENLPSTETEIYKHFTEQTLLRKLKRNNSDAGHDAIIKIVGNINFKKICELAYNMTIHSKQVMYQDELSLSDTSGSDEPSLGLVTVDLTTKLYGHKDYYTFLHLTFQEYLAAWHITQLTFEEQTVIICSYGGKDFMRVVWKFYCGLTQFDEDAHFMNIFSDLDDDLFKIQCAFESQQSIPCDSILENEDEGCFSFRDCFMTTLDFTAIGYVIKNAVTHPVETLVFDDCRFGEEDVIALQKEAGSSVSSITSLHLRGTCNQEESLCALVKCFTYLEELVLAMELEFTKLLKHCSNLKTLNLHADIYLGSSGVTALADGLKHCCNLQTLNLHGNSIGSYGAKALADGLKHCSNLQTLDLHGNNICSSGATALADGLKHCSNLQILILYDNCIHFSGAKALANGIEGCYGLQTLDIGHNDIGADGAKVLADRIKDFHHLQTLVLGHNSIGPDGAKALADGIEGCYGLQTLDIGHNDIGADGAKVLADRIKDFHHLQTLDLGHNNINTDGAMVLAYKIQHFLYLQTLVLGHNNIGSDGAKALADGILIGCCRGLHTLDLGHNDIGSDGAKALADGIRIGCCHGLQTLVLGHNDIGSDGTKAFADSIVYCNKLQTLDLSNNNIGSDGVEALAYSIWHCDKLQTLDLSNNNIGSDGVKAFADSIKYCNKLQTLDLSNNNIGSNSVKAFADSI